MNEGFNIYCDESCHLENDGQGVMVLGAVWCPWEMTRVIADEIRDIKEQHGLPRNFEIKWSKVFPSKLDMYLDLIAYFFENDDLNFRCVVIPDKQILKHEEFGQDHDTWYYKMYYTMLKHIIAPPNEYEIYLDIKDTSSAQKIKKLHEVLSCRIYDFSNTIIHRIQTVRSNEVEQIQLADLLIGAVGYSNRKLESSKTKLQIINLIEQLSNRKLINSSPYRNKKFNLLIWRPGVKSIEK